MKEDTTQMLFKADSLERIIDAAAKRVWQDKGPLMEHISGGVAGSMYIHRCTVLEEKCRLCQWDGLGVSDAPHRSIVCSMCGGLTHIISLKGFPDVYECESCLARCVGLCSYGSMIIHMPMSPRLEPKDDTI